MWEGTGSLNLAGNNISLSGQVNQKGTPPHWDDALVDTIRQVSAQGGSVTVQMLIDKLREPLDLQVLEQIRQSAPVLADIARQWRQNFGFDEDRWRQLENEIYNSMSVLTDTTRQIRQELESLKPADRIEILKPLLLAGIDPELLPLAWIQSPKIAQEEYESKRNRYINILTDLESKKRLMYSNIRQMLQADMEADLRTLSNARMFFNNMLNTLLKQTQSVIGAIQQQMRLDNQLKQDTFKRKQVFLEVWRAIVDKSRQIYNPEQARQYLKMAYPWLRQLAGEAGVPLNAFTEEKLLSTWVPDARALLNLEQAKTQIPLRDFYRSGTIRNYASTRNLNAKTERELLNTGIAEYRLFHEDVSKRIEQDLALTGNRERYAAAAETIVKFLQERHGTSGYFYRNSDDLVNTYRALRSYIENISGGQLAADRAIYANTIDYWFTTHAMLIAARQRGYQTQGLPSEEPIHMIAAAAAAATTQDDLSPTTSPMSTNQPLNRPQDNTAAAGVLGNAFSSMGRNTTSPTGSNNPIFGNQIIDQ